MRDLTRRSPSQVVCIVAAIALAAGACTGGDDSAEPPAPSSTTQTTGDEPTTSAPVATDEADGDAADGDDAAGDVEPDEEVVPARRVPSQVSDETTHWVGHGTMTEDAIEVAWSEVEGDDVVYQIFRFDSIGLDREAVELVNPIHEGIGTLSWTDESVEAGQFYTYIMRVIADDEVLERRWTNTLAVTDETPPAEITGLTATLADGEVLLEWDPSSDDVEFGSYGVFRTDLADEAQYVGGGGDLAVTSFIDNDLPASGEVGYEVIAYDFHGNRSTPVSITITIP